MQSIGAAHQFRMSPFRLAHMDSPAVVSPHCVGYRDEHWMPHVAFVHTRVPLQSCSEFCGNLAKGTPQDWIPSAGKQLSAYARQTACQEQALTSAPAMLQLGAVGRPWVPRAPLRAFISVAAPVVRVRGAGLVAGPAEVGVIVQVGAEFAAVGRARRWIGCRALHRAIPCKQQPGCLLVLAGRSLSC